MKKLLLLLDADVRRILFLLLSTSATYDTLLAKTQLSETTLDTLLQKLSKNKMIFVSNNIYYLHSSFQKSMLQMLLKLLFKIALFIVTFFFTRSYTKQTKLHREMLKKYLH